MLLVRLLLHFNGITFSYFFFFRNVLIFFLLNRSKATVKSFVMLQFFFKTSYPFELSSNHRIIKVSRFPQIISNSIKQLFSALIIITTIN